MTFPATADDPRMIEAPGLRVVFRWGGDRWTHAVEVASGRMRHEVVRSVEERSDRPDPSRVISPTYQDVHPLDGKDGGRRAALIGMAGPHHFSAVFALEPGEGGATVLAVDVADRCRADVLGLAASYRVALPPSRLEQADPTAASWDLPDGRLTLEAGEGSAVTIEAAGPGAVIAQAVATIEPGRATRRFMYRWLWTPKYYD